MWNAIVNQDEIIRYFTSSVSSSIVEGKKIDWEFADYNVTVKIEVPKVIENELIVFKWGASGNEAEVQISLSATKDNFTKVEITEKEFEATEDGIQKIMQQTQGWTNFICSMKAWLYTGVNLRNGEKQ